MSQQNTWDHSKVGKGRFLSLVLILGSLSAFGPLSIDMYLPSLPALTADLHTNASSAQLSLTACLLGLAFGQLLVGPFSDIKGRRRPLIVALCLYSIASILCAFASSIWLLVALRFLQGVTGSAGIVIARASVRDLFSGSELTKFFSLLMLVNGVAPILAPVIGGQLLQFISWRGVFVVLCVIGIIMLLSVVFGLEETLKPSMRSEGGIKNIFGAFAQLLKDRLFVSYAVIQGLITGAMFAYISGSPFVIQTIFGASPQLFSVLFAINGIGIIIASQITGRLAEKLGETKLLVAGLIFAAFGSILLLAATVFGLGMLAVCIGFFMIVSSVGIVNTTIFSLAMQNQEQNAGSASALLGLLQFVFGAVAAPLVGLGGEGTAIPLGIIIAVCDVGALLLYMIFVRRHRMAMSKQSTLNA